MKLPPKLKAFVEESDWTFAKTYAQTWPHEYIVRDRVDESPFLSLVRHIREHGYKQILQESDHILRRRRNGLLDDGSTHWGNNHRESMHKRANL